jgi:hypothetical protein
MKRRDDCTRRWQAEAIEDGRLNGPERTSFEKHLGSCTACQKEVAELAELGAAMKHAPSFVSLPIQRRRVRASLLRSAHEQAIGARARSGWRAWYMAPAVALVLVTLLFVGRTPLQRLVQPALASPPTFEITPVDGAEWTTRTTGAIVHVRLASGSASFHVQRTRDHQRFLLDLPDGEIEVRGTRFLVELRDRMTRHVAVSEGLVVLRLRGESERHLARGESWDRAEPPAALSAAGTSSAMGGRGAESAGTASATGAPIGAASRRDSARRPPDRPDPTAAQDPFAAGVDALRAGEYVLADRLLAQFLKESPRDARAEDAQFLRAVARSRAGDAAGAAELAEEYLRKFPKGLRRPEAQTMAAGR